MSDLVKGLREAASGKGGLDYGDLWAYCDDAADEIERLRAELAEARRERDRLREAIEEAEHDMDCESIRIKDDGYGPVMVDAYPPKPCNCWKRAALEGKP